jgi:hypothetical protein
MLVSGNNTAERDGGEEKKRKTNNRLSGRYPCVKKINDFGEFDYGECRMLFCSLFFK